MEWIPRLYDTLDSIAFELRARWIGYHGQSFRSLVLLMGLIVLSAVSPLFRNVAVAMLTSFLFAEMVWTVFEKAPRPRFATR